MMRTRSTIVVVLSLSLTGVLGCSRDEVASDNPAAKAPARNARKVVAEGGTLVDVRTPEEFADGHVQGARNIPVDDLAARKSEIPKDHPVVVYCHSGSRSAQAAKLLRADGYDVIDIKSMSKW